MVFTSVSLETGECSTLSGQLIELLKKIGTSDYIIGPSARDYLDNEKENKINDNGINLIWMDYSGYPEYRQLYPPFDHYVSIIDLIFNVGPDAPAYMKSFR